MSREDIAVPDCPFVRINGGDPTKYSNHNIEETREGLDIYFNCRNCSVNAVVSYRRISTDRPRLIPPRSSK